LRRLITFGSSNHDSQIRLFAKATRRSELNTTHTQWY
jgi:hypothetical protein